MVVLSGRGPGCVDSPGPLYTLWVEMRKVAFRISVDRARVTLANEQCFKSGQQSPPHSSMANTEPYSKLGSKAISLYMRSASVGTLVDTDPINIEPLGNNPKNN